MLEQKRAASQYQGIFERSRAMVLQPVNLAHTYRP
jgi:hypothetical protein